MTTDDKRLALQAYFDANPNGGLDLADTETGRFDIAERRRLNGKIVGGMFDPKDEETEDLQVTHLTQSGFLCDYIDPYGNRSEEDVIVSYDEAPEATIEAAYTLYEAEVAKGTASVALDPFLWGNGPKW